jgi:hypothetical protein
MLMLEDFAISFNLAKAEKIMAKMFFNIAKFGFVIAQTGKNRF